eukprot:scaffold53567_cov48-Phaeocystis_antarctica.AAC.1
MITCARVRARVSVRFRDDHLRRSGGWCARGLSCAASRPEGRSAWQRSTPTSFQPELPAPSS